MAALATVMGTVMARREMSDALDRAPALGCLRGVVGGEAIRFRAVMCAANLATYARLGRLSQVEANWSGGPVGGQAFGRLVKAKDHRSGGYRLGRSRSVCVPRSTKNRRKARLMCRAANSNRGHLEEKNRRPDAPRVPLQCRGRKFW